MFLVFKFLLRKFYELLLVRVHATVELRWLIVNNILFLFVPLPAELPGTCPHRSRHCVVVLESVIDIIVEVVI